MSPRTPAFAWPLLLLLTLASTAYAAVDVRGVRLWAGPENTRVVLDLNRASTHRLFVLHSPERVVIDVHGGRWAGAAASAPSGGVVRGVRHGQRPNGDLRIVLDVSQSVHPNSFSVAPNDVYGHRLVVDLGLQSRGSKPIKAAPSDGERDLVIAIDAGHGGEDPGASGPGGTREKDVVFGIAQALATMVEREPGMRPLLTRDGDYFVTLRGRMERARKHRADIFVSIHADAFRDARARGATVYALSASGASSEAGRWLAERENAADLIGGVELNDKDDVLASVLLDLSQSATISASLQAGKQVLSELDGVAHVRKRTVQQAGFIVLKSPDIPSLLVETAYISNPSEERTLRDPGAQRRLAGAILRGIRAYFYEQAIPGTLVARLAAEEPITPRTYTISRGDTLSGIASRFDVTVRGLRAVNGLANDRLRIGQVLTIPGSSGGH